MRDLIAAGVKRPKLELVTSPVSQNLTCLPRPKSGSSCRKQAKAISSFVASVLSETRAALADPDNQDETTNAKHQEITNLAQEILVLVDLLFADYKIQCISPGGTLADDQPPLLSN